MRELSFFVAGIPKPAGSKSAAPYRKKDGRLGVAVRDACKGSKDWKAIVAYTARQVYEGPPMEGPLELRVVFNMPRPKNHYGKKGLKPEAPEWHDKRPDSTKLVRCVEDALNGVVWLDDAQIVKQGATKRYGDAPGVAIRIRRLT